MTLGATQMVHCALIINLKVTEGGLFALVLVLLPQFAMAAAVCAVFYRYRCSHSAQGQGDLSRCMSSWACPGLICSSWPWEVSVINSMYREGNRFGKCKGVQWQGGAWPPGWSSTAAHRSQSCLGPEE